MKKATKKNRPPKYKIGDLVYSYQNPTNKRAINRVRISHEYGFKHAYRLTLKDRSGNSYNSNWINENSLRKTKIR